VPAVGDRSTGAGARWIAPLGRQRFQQSASCRYDHQGDAGRPGTGYHRSDRQRAAFDDPRANRRRKSTHRRGPRVAGHWRSTRRRPTRLVRRPRRTPALRQPRVAGRTPASAPPPPQLAAQAGRLQPQNPVAWQPVMVDSSHSRPKLAPMQARLSSTSSWSGCRALKHTPGRRRSSHCTPGQLAGAAGPRPIKLDESPTTKVARTGELFVTDRRQT
jgi:hypothetical protein